MRIRKCEYGRVLLCYLNLMQTSTLHLYSCLLFNGFSRVLFKAVLKSLVELTFVVTIKMRLLLKSVTMDRQTAIEMLATNKNWPWIVCCYSFFFIAINNWAANRCLFVICWSSIGNILNMIMINKQVDWLGANQSVHRRNFRLLLVSKNQRVRVLLVVVASWRL